MATKHICDVCGAEMAGMGNWRRLPIDAPEALHKDKAVRLAVTVRADSLNNDDADLDLCDSCLAHIVAEAIESLLPERVAIVMMPPKELPEVTS